MKVNLLAAKNKNKTKEELLNGLTTLRWYPDVDIQFWANYSDTKI